MTLFFFFVKKLMANISIIHEEAIDFFGWKDWLLSTCPLQRKSSLTQRCVCVGGKEGCLCARVCSVLVCTLFMCIFFIKLLDISYKCDIMSLYIHILERKMHIHTVKMPLWVFITIFRLPYSQRLS